MPSWAVRMASPELEVRDQLTGLGRASRARLGRGQARSVVGDDVTESTALLPVGPRLRQFLQGFARRSSTT